MRSHRRGTPWVPLRVLGGPPHLGAGGPLEGNAKHHQGLAALGPSAPRWEPMLPSIARPQVRGLVVDAGKCPFGARLSRAGQPDNHGSPLLVRPGL
jgi:hypothetical protein